MASKILIVEDDIFLGDVLMQKLKSADMTRYHTRRPFGPIGYGSGSPTRAFGYYSSADEWV